MPIHSLRFSLIFTLISLMVACEATNEARNSSIDRYALVSRHNVVFTDYDSLNVLTVGNGEFAFTVDVTGLQSFPEYYESGIALGTQAQWAWHSSSNDGDYQYDEVLQDYESCNHHIASYAIQHEAGRQKEATDWLRANPHRLHLGLIGLELYDRQGRRVSLSEINNIHQELDLWQGIIRSTFEIDGTPVTVHTAANPHHDQIAFQITSPLLQSGHIKIYVHYPYGKECHVCPGYDFDKSDRHTSQIIKQSENQIRIKRSLDDDIYWSEINLENHATISQDGQHYFSIHPTGESDSFSASISFAPESDELSQTSCTQTFEQNKDYWPSFWQSGAAVDFSQCTDPRAKELERRVILSQYLTKIQCSGSMPPQETGLTFNSWYGKFHIEMHWWHGVHFALWNRIDQLINSLDFYQSALGKARSIADRQNYRGARWQKMTTPQAISSPSSVGEFLIWQQPHPIYFAELVYRHSPSVETLKQYKEIVFETAEFMASFAQFNPADSFYHLCQPIIPAQEIFPATETYDPPFELAYWHYGLSTAQKWRERLGLEVNREWQDVIDRLAPLDIYENHYLPAAGATTAYTDEAHRRDHPIVTGVLGMLPEPIEVDPAIMKNTLKDILSNWNWQTTWGWDYPMLAMCAARIGEPELAIDALLMDTQKNTYLPNGHNYQDDRLRIYLPGNGGLLTAIAMMAGGWDGSSSDHPGFPKNGKWQIRSEGFVPMP